MTLGINHKAGIPFYPWRVAPAYLLCHCEDTKQSQTIQGEDAKFAVATLAMAWRVPVIPAGIY